MPEPEMKVAEVRRGAEDRHRNPITEVYQRKRDLYAIYRTRGRVLVHFADDDEKSDEQRRALAPLLPLRDEIDGLVQGWRDAEPDDGNGDPAGRGSRGFFGMRDAARLRSKVRCQDRRVAGALAQALEDDVPGAHLLLQKIKGDVLNERIASGRFEYLLTAFAAALVAMFIAWMLSSLLPLDAAAKPAGGGIWAIGRTWRFGLVALLLAAAAGLAFATSREEMSWRRAALIFAIVAIPIVAMLVWPATSTERIGRDYTAGLLMWRGFAAGAVGAFFSIAIAIRGRTVLPDLLRTANMLDAGLRVTVGAIGGAVLIALVHGDVVRFLLVNPANSLWTLVAGFVAGFSERLVPDLLARVGERPVEFDAQMAASRAQREARVEARAEAVRKDAARPEAAAAGTAEAAENDNLPDDDEEVGPEGFQLEDDEKTQDEELPAAAGGVKA